jgi:hypothetical protein
MRSRLSNHEHHEQHNIDTQGNKRGHGDWTKTPAVGLSREPLQDRHQGESPKGNSRDQESPSTRTESEPTPRQSKFASDERGRCSKRPITMRSRKKVDQLRAARHKQDQYDGT